MPPRIVVASVAALTLVLGFAVAQASGSRPLGAVVLVLGAAACAWWWWRSCGPARALAALGVGAVAFAVSHPLGAVIGAWPAVLVVAILGGLAAYALTAPRAGLRNGAAAAR